MVDATACVLVATVGSSFILRAGSMSFVNKSQNVAMAMQTRIQIR